jgi:hypothetical protein
MTKCIKIKPLDTVLKSRAGGNDIMIGRIG